MKDKELYKSLVLVIIISILIVLAFNIYMKNKIMQKEGFSEIFFNRYELLPDKIYINESINISFRISNNNLNRTNYILEVDSTVNNFTETYSLDPNEYRDVNLIIEPKEKKWEILFYTNYDYIIETDVTDGFIAEMQNTSYLLKEGVEYYPLSHEITGFGEIYHTNISLEELKTNPINKYYESMIRTNEEKKITTKNITLFVKNDKIFSKNVISQEIYIAPKSPFIIKFYKTSDNVDEALEIHFWYEVV